jgi:hypothetical protein
MSTTLRSDAALAKHSLGIADWIAPVLIAAWPKRARHSAAHAKCFTCRAPRTGCTTKYPRK